MTYPDTEEEVALAAFSTRSNLGKALKRRKTHKQVPLPKHAKPMRAASLALGADSALLKEELSDADELQSKKRKVRDAIRTIVSRDPIGNRQATQRRQVHEKIPNLAYDY